MTYRQLVEKLTLISPST